MAKKQQSQAELLGFTLENLTQGSVVKMDQPNRITVLFDSGLGLMFSRSIDGWEPRLAIHAVKDEESAVFYSAHPDQSMRELWGALAQAAYEQQEDRQQNLRNLVHQSVGGGVK